MDKIVNKVVMLIQGQVYTIDDTTRIYIYMYNRQCRYTTGNSQQQSNKIHNRRDNREAAEREIPQ